MNSVYLSTLTLRYEPAEKLVEFVFKPAFDTVKREFTAELPKNADNVQLEVKPADPEAGNSPIPKLSRLY